MNAIATVLLALVFLGLPFYWGTLGHHGFALPIVWAIVVALIVSARHWRHLTWEVMYSFALTLVMSLAACTLVYEIGHALS